MQTDPTAPALGTVEIDTPPELAHALPNHEEAKAPLVGVLGEHQGRHETRAIVHHLDDELAGPNLEGHLGSSRLGVFDHVLEQLTHTLKQGAPRLVAEGHVPVLAPEGQLEAVTLPELTEQPIDGRREPDLVEHGRAELEGEGPDILDRLVHQGERLTEDGLAGLAEPLAGEHAHLDLHRHEVLPDPDVDELTSLVGFEDPDRGRTTEGLEPLDRPLRAGRRAFDLARLDQGDGKRLASRVAI